MVVDATLPAGATGPWGGASMTEAEWLACDDPPKMLAFMEGRMTMQKRSLFAHACGRRDCRIWSREKYGTADEADFWLAKKAHIDQLCARTLDAADERCDGSDRSEEVERLRNEAFQIGPIGLTWDLTCIKGDVDYWVNKRFPLLPSSPSAQASLDAGLLWETYAVYQFQVGLFRELIRNPFHSAALDPARLTLDAAALAQAAYDERVLPFCYLDLARLSILADALEDIGCTDEAILSHLRSPGPHVRGCWALDLLLGKS
jgi:hypothetical protein